MSNSASSYTKAELSEEKLKQKTKAFYVYEGTTDLQQYGTDVISTSVTAKAELPAGGMQATVPDSRAASHRKPATA
jgi:hypothetical protein